jgi:hypothetical protein
MVGGFHHDYRRAAHRNIYRVFFCIDGANARRYSQLGETEVVNATVERGDVTTQRVAMRHTVAVVRAREPTPHPVAPGSAGKTSGPRPRRTEAHAQPGPVAGARYICMGRVQ